MTTRSRNGTSSSDGDAALRVEDVSVTLGGQQILHDVSFSAQEGEGVALIGPNGSGKTTLLRAVSGAVERTGGVHLDGRPVEEWSSRERARRLAFVRQGAGISFDLSVRDLVLLGRAPHRGWLAPFNAEDEACVDRVLQRVDLTSFAERSVQSLSGGELQRAFLAQALAQEARVLLLDEPTAHLDVHYQFELFGQVRELVDEGRSVVAVVHDLELAARFADRLLVMDQGRIVARGTPPQVLTPRLIARVFGMQASVRSGNNSHLRVDYRSPVER